MKKFLASALFLASAIAFVGCEKDSPSIPIQRYDLSQGMLITNEGDWGKNNASISLYYTSGDSIANDVFKKVNGREMGDVLQSMKIVDTLAYFVLNGSGKIEVASAKSCKSVATIKGIGNPRFMESYGNKGYISAWDNDEVVVFDLKTNAILKSIKVGTDPEGMLVVGTKLFVANSSGMGGKNNTISVVDLTTDAVIKTITVADCPRNFVADRNGNVWVVCSGFVDWVVAANSTNAAICKVNPTTYEVTKIDLGSFRPTQIHTNSNRDKVYYGGGYSLKGIYQLELNATTAPGKPLIDETIYGFTVSPTTNEIFCFAAFSYTENDNKMFRYNANGTLLNSKTKSFLLGVGPNSGYFVQ